MKIIIAGCGKVGFTLAEQLNEEGHEIILIDTDGETLQSVSSTLDVMGVIGSATSYRVQTEAGIETADLLIAVTDRDEINLLACLIAKKTGDHCQTIARVRSPEYSEEVEYLQEELGLAMSVNPEFNAAAEIFRLIQFPSALDIDTFAKGQVNLVKVRIPESSRLNGIKLMNISNQLGFHILICIVERDHEVIIPDGHFTLQAGDDICFISPFRKLARELPKLGFFTHAIKRVLIAGGGTISYYLAQMLLKAKKEVKIIEENPERCEVLSSLLPKAMIICGNATEQNLLMEEGLAESDCVVTLTSLDEENILLSLYASKVTKAKVITKIQRISFNEVVKDMAIGSVICPKNMTAENIIRFVRSKQHSMGSNVERLYRMMDNRVEAMEFIVQTASKATGTPLQQLSLRPNTLICCIFRDEEVLTPTGTDCIMPGDRVILVTTFKGLKSIDDIILPTNN